MAEHEFVARINDEAKPSFAAVEKRVQALGDELFAGQDFGAGVLRTVIFDLWAEAEPNLLRQLDCRPYPGERGTVFLAAHLPLEALKKATAAERVALAMSTLAATAKHWLACEPIPTGFDLDRLVRHLEQLLVQRDLVRAVSPLFLGRFPSLSITHQGSRVYSKFSSVRFTAAFNTLAATHLAGLGGDLRNVRLYLEYLEDGSADGETTFRLDPFQRWANPPGIEALVWLRLSSARYGSLGAKAQLALLSTEVLARLRDVPTLDPSYLPTFASLWNAASTTKPGK